MSEKIQERLRDRYQGFRSTYGISLERRLHASISLNQEAADHIDTLEARVAELEGVVDGMPTTADGHPVGFGTTVFRTIKRCETGKLLVCPMTIRSVEFMAYKTLFNGINSVDCYSTEAAARDAMGGEG